jgi:hypothetical protein
MTDAVLATFESRTWPEAPPSIKEPWTADAPRVDVLGKLRGMWE